MWFGERKCKQVAEKAGHQVCRGKGEGGRERGSEFEKGLSHYGIVYMYSIVWWVMSFDERRRQVRQEKDTSPAMEV